MLRVSLLSVFVRDQDAAIRFYRDQLGFVLVEDVPFGPHRWVTMRAPDDATLAIALKVPPPEDANLVGKQAGSQPLVALRTDDCMATYRRMKALGVTFLGEPEVAPYGTGVTLEDLYGNRIFLNEEPR